MPDTPFLVGYDYSADPATVTGENAETQTRRLPLILVRTAADSYVDLSDQASIRFGQTTIQVEFPGDNISGSSFRYLGDEDGSIESAYDYDKLVMTFSVQLPTRLRLASGDSTSPRRKRIYQPGLHLWLQHTNCVHDVDGDGTGSGVLRFPTTGFTKIRDDADELEIKHKLAWEWYGGDHRAASWELRCCGLQPKFSTGYLFDPNKEVSGGQVEYPTLGQYVTDLWHSGRTVDVEAQNDNILYTTLNTVVTSIEYDNDRGTTRWSTDWTDLDFGG